MLSQIQIFSAIVRKIVEKERAVVLQVDKKWLLWLWKGRMSNASYLEGKLVTVYGKVVTIWRKEAAGDWKCVIDIWNESPPSEQ
jgi:ketosteroid isomerase-like protein